MGVDLVQVFRARGRAHYRHTITLVVDLVEKLFF